MTTGVGKMEAMETAEMGAHTSNKNLVDGGQAKRQRRWDVQAGEVAGGGEAADISWTMLGRSLTSTRLASG